MVPIAILLILFLIAGPQAQEDYVLPGGPDDVRLAGRCAGRPEIKRQGEWKPMMDTDGSWNLKSTAVMCRQLGCGSAVSRREHRGTTKQDTWEITSHCTGSESSLKECVIEMWVDVTFNSLEVICSESRLVNGAGLCSGRVEVKSNQSWTSVSEGDFDWQDAKVLCRELGCGAPSALYLYTAVEAPVWTKEFQCEGSESFLLDCASSGSARNTSLPAKAVGLTCSEPDDVRLVGVGSRCAGTLEMKHWGEWRPTKNSFSIWNLKTATVACRQLSCGSVVSNTVRHGSKYVPTFWYESVCNGSEPALRECGNIVRQASSAETLEVNCSESTRLVNGVGLCSGRVEVKVNQSWASACEADFDWKDAEVVCRELGCGAPSALQGALYGDVEAPVQAKEFQCEGSESFLLDCATSGSTRTTCLPGKAVGLTCSEPDDVRLVGGNRCAGNLEIKHQGEWRPVLDSSSDWVLENADVVCRQQGCGSVVSKLNKPNPPIKPVWMVTSQCDGTEFALRECGMPRSKESVYTNEVICSDILFKPDFTISPSVDVVFEGKPRGRQVFRGRNLTITCSIEPQYLGGYFDLTFTSLNRTHIRTEPAVRHSADFLFSAVDDAHQGNYICVYRIYVFSHNFSSESEPFSLIVTDFPVTYLISRLTIVVLLTLMASSSALCLYCMVTSGQKPKRKVNVELVYCNLVDSNAEAGPAEEAGDQGTE